MKKEKRNIILALAVVIPITDLLLHLGHWFRISLEKLYRQVVVEIVDVLFHSPILWYSNVVFYRYVTFSTGLLYLQIIGKETELFNF